VSTYLLLSKNTAYWSHWQNGQCIATFQEPIPATPVTATREEPPQDLLPRIPPSAADRHQQVKSELDSSTRCPWLTVTHQRVHILIDSPTESVESRWLSKSEGGLHHVRTRYQMRRVLRHQYPGARVQSHVWSDQRDLLTVHHIRLPDAWQCWLKRLQHRRLTAISLQTLSEVLAQGTSKSSDAMRALTAVNNGPAVAQRILQIVHTAGAQRHSLVYQGKVLFTRYVRHCDSSVQSIIAAVKESVDHLVCEELITDDMLVHGVGLSAQAVDALCELPEVSNVELLIDVDNPSPTKTFVGVIEAGINTTLNATSKPVLESSLQDRALVDTVHKQCAYYYGDSSEKKSHWIQCVKRQMNRLWRIRQGLKQQIYQPVLEKYLERRAYAGLRLATIASAAIACQFVAMAVIVGIDSIQRHRALGLQSITTQQARQDLVAEASQLHHQPVQMANALSGWAELQQSLAVKPQDMLVILADVVDDHAEVQINELSWIASDRAASLRNNDIAHTSTDRMAWPDGLVSEPVWLSIAGTVDSSRSRSDAIENNYHDNDLTQQQSALGEFVSALESHSRIDQVRVRHSPLSGYLSVFEASASPRRSIDNPALLLNGLRGARTFSVELRIKGVSSKFQEIAQADVVHQALPLSP